MSGSPDFSLSKESILVDPPLGGKVSIEEVTPSDGGLLMNQLMIPCGVDGGMVEP
jgi:hypothetical protein